MKAVKSILSKITIEHLWVITAMAGIIVFLNTHPIRPHDFWFHLTIGKDILVTKSIPITDIYSFTRYGMPYLSYHQFWMAEIILFLIYKTGGPILIILIQTLFVSSAYAVLMWIGYRQSRNWRAVAFSLLFAASIGFGNWNVRPQTFSYLFGTLVLLAISEFKITRKRGWLIVFPVILALWVNNHGSFPIGLVLIGIWLTDESWKAALKWMRASELDLKSWYQAVISLLLALVGCVLNPRGIGFIQYLSTMTSNSIVQNFILEWRPPGFDSLEGTIFLVVFMASVIILAISPKRPDFYQLLTFLIFGLLGFKYIRGIIWYGIVMTPIMSQHVAALLKQLGIQPSTLAEPRFQRINLIFVVGLMALVFLSLPWFKSYWPVIPEKRGLIASETGVEATQFLIDERLPPQLFHGMGYGSYLMWKAYPEFQTFVDSRIELFPPNLWNDYLTVSNAVVGWEEKLDSYGVNTLMLEPESQARLIIAAAESANWEIVYQDQAAVIFTRR